MDFLETYHGNIIVSRRNAISYTLSHRSLRTLDTGDLAQTNKMGLGGHLSDPTNLFALSQKRNIQILAVAFATLSFSATLVTIYWFFMMKRNFRRQ